MARFSVGDYVKCTHRSLPYCGTVRKIYKPGEYNNLNIFVYLVDLDCKREDLGGSPYVDILEKYKGKIAVPISQMFLEYEEKIDVSQVL